MLGEVLEQVAGACVLLLLAVPAPCLKSLSRWKIPLLSCTGTLSFSSLLWDLLSPELGFVTLQQ